MEIENLTDIEFCELIKKVIERLESEGSHATVVKGAFSDALILIDRDDELNNQIPRNPMKSWFNLKLTMIAQKEIKL